MNCLAFAIQDVDLDESRKRDRGGHGGITWNRPSNRTGNREFRCFTCLFITENHIMRQSRS
jgi:hypothetical protein